MQTPTAESFSDMVKRYAFSAGDTLTDDEKRQAFMNAILGGQREFAFLDGRLALAAEGYGLRTWEVHKILSIHGVIILLYRFFTLFRMT